MSIIHATRLDFDNAMAAGKRSIELAPNVATNHGVLALIHYYCGNHAQSLMWTRKAIRLSPYFPDWFLIPLGEGYRGTGALDKARDVFEHFAVRTPDSLLPQTILACIYAKLDEMAKAQHATETVLSIDPDFSVENDALQESSGPEEICGCTSESGIAGMAPRDNASAQRRHQHAHHWRGNTMMGRLAARWQSSPGRPATSAERLLNTSSRRVPRS